MVITKENIDELNAVVKVQVSPNDYNEKVEQALKSYQKRHLCLVFVQESSPSLVRKMYGKSVLAEEVNKLLSDSLYKYIQDNKLDVLGNPLPKDDNNQIDFENQQEFEFQFDMALAPQFNLELNSKLKFSEYKVQIEDKLIDGYISDMTRRYGKIVPTDSASDGDLIYGDFVELDEKGEVVAGGIYKSSTMFLDTPVKEEHKVLIGAKAEGKYDLTAKQISDNPKDLAGKLGIEQQQAEGLNATFRFTVKTINRLLPAEQNAELFEKYMDLA